MERCFIGHYLTLTFFTSSLSEASGPASEVTLSKIRTPALETTLRIQQILKCPTSYTSISDSFWRASSRRCAASAVALGFIWRKD